MNKKGNVNQITGFALGLVILALVIAIGLSVATTMQDTGIGIGSSIDRSSTFKASNTSYVSFNSADQLSCSNVVLVNGTNKKKVTGNFTVSGCTALLVDKDSYFNSSTIMANYTFTHYTYDKQYNATASNISAVGTIPGWIPVIIVAMVGGIVLFLVIRQFGGR